MPTDYIVNDLVLKKELSDEDQIKLLEWIVKGYDGEEWKYYQPHLKTIFNRYKNNIEIVKRIESKIIKLEIENNIN